MVKVPHKTLEHQALAEGRPAVIGVDEVGMGCLAGPVVVCAVMAGAHFFKQSTSRQLAWLRDSKMLQPHQRQIFYDRLRHMGLRFEIAFCTPATIDKINIYQASRRAMRQAISKLTPPPGSLVLVDGPRPIAGLAVSPTLGFELDQQAIIKGDRKVFIIACASIIAKVYRDHMMIQYAKRFPGYGFEQHKGYGTSYHKQKLQELGPCSLHRKSFRLS